MARTWRLISVAALTTNCSTTGCSAGDGASAGNEVVVVVAGVVVVVLVVEVVEVVEVLVLVVLRGVVVDGVVVEGSVGTAPPEGSEATVAGAQAEASTNTSAGASRRTAEPVR